MGDMELNLYRNMGSSITIITPAMYKESMSKVVTAKRYLRTRGSPGYLDTKGMFKTTLTTASGASTRTWVYMVVGARLEVLLGDHDTEALGIVSTNQEGSPPKEGQEGETLEDINNASIPSMLRRAGKEVITKRPPHHKVETKGKEETTRIVNRYKRPVFTETKTKKWQDNEHKINKNSDARQYNKGAKQTSYQVTTTQEERHELKRAKVHSEFDRGNYQGRDDMYKAKGARPGRHSAGRGSRAGQQGAGQRSGAGQHGAGRGSRAGRQGAGRGSGAAQQGAGRGTPDPDGAGRGQGRQPQERDW